MSLAISTMLKTFAERRTHYEEESYREPFPEDRRCHKRGHRTCRGARCRRRADAGVQRALSPAVSFHAGAELDERPERDGLLPGRVPPLLPVQPVRGYLGAHLVGARGQ